MTGRHLVVLLTPFVVEPERWSSGHISFLDAHVWRPGLGTRVLTIHKDTLEPVRRHELPLDFIFITETGGRSRTGRSGSICARRRIRISLPKTCGQSCAVK